MRDLYRASNASREISGHICRIIMVRVSSNTQTKVPRFDRSGETSGRI